MNRIFKIGKYIVALLPSTVTLTVIFVGLLVLPISIIPNLDIVASEIIFMGLMLTYGIRVSNIKIDKFYKLLYWIIGVLAVVLFFIWSKKLLLIQPLQLLLYVILCEGRLRNFRNYIKKNVDVFSCFNIYDLVCIFICFLVGSNEDGIQNSIINILKSLNISASYVDTVLGALFLLFWLLLMPIIRSLLGIYFYKKQNPVNLPVDRVLWGTYLLSHFLSIVSIASYISIYFTLYETNQNFIFIMLIYSIYLSLNILFWGPIYESLNKLGDNKEKLISSWIMTGIVAVSLVLIDQIESEIIGILSWFLPVLLPNFIGEIYKLSDEYQRREKIRQTPKMEKHLYWLTMMSFNTLLIFNIISTLDKDNHLKGLMISALDSLSKSGDSSHISLSIFSSFIIVLFSILLAWGLSKIIVKLLKNIYLDPRKEYFK